MNDPLLLLIVIGILIPVFFLILFLFIQHPNKQTKNLLIIGFTFVVIGYSFELTRYLKFWDAAAVLFLFYFPFLFILYPIFYLYLKSIIWRSFRLTGKSFFKYFSFTLLSTIILWIYYIPLTIQHKIIFITYTSGELPLHTDDASVVLVLIILYYIQAVVYLFSTIRIAINISRTSRKEIVINEERLPLWTWILTYALFSYEIIGSLIMFIFDVPVKSIEILEDILFNVFVAFIGFFGLKQYDLTVQTKLRKLSFYFENENGAQKVSLKLTFDQKKNIAETLQKYITEKKYYLDPNLKIEQLAKKIHVPYKNLSLVINELLGKNFTTLLNEYRIEEAKRIISCGLDTESFEDVYIRVGFNSRSTFNRVFKSLMGLTPSEFKESLHTAA